MPLDEYRRKRDFSCTPEPLAADQQETPVRLRFVIHKHEATRLHYDLRLELQGVLKSWAVPKGPSLDPAEKRLAVMVEDHPLDYRDFEGVIPAGNYGAGPEMIWDEGTYHPSTEEGSAGHAEQVLTDMIRKGNVSFVLEGTKVHGGFHLARMHHGDNQWLLFKKHDGFASTEDILAKDRSARTGRSMDQIAGNGTGAADRHQIDIAALDLRGAPRIPFPGPVRPMLAQLAKSPFDGPGWVFEIKWDGYRAVAETHRERLPILYSRNFIDFSKDYPPIIEDLRRLDFEAIFDGEIVVVDDQGRSDFELMQNFRDSGTGTLVYYVFDLLYLDGFDLRHIPLWRRKELLRRILPELPHIKYSSHREGQGQELYRLAQKFHLEGIVAKHRDSPYVSGVRTQYWQKIKTVLQQEMVVGGFTDPRGARAGFGALIVGVYEGKNLVYCGLVGGGFTEDELRKVKLRLDPLVRPTSPFTSVPGNHAGMHWLEPKLVCEVRFSEWTGDFVMRQPVYLGMRYDIEPASVHRELPVAEPPSSIRFAPAADQPQQISIDGRMLQLTHVNKRYWPRDGITKGMMIDYYREIARFIVPHLIDRPETLHRFPDGIGSESFYQKNIDDAPPWVKTIRLESDAQRETTNYLLCQDEAALVYMANLGSFEIHPWISRAGHLDYPDYMVIDLDPFECGFDLVIAAANSVHQVLADAQCPHYVKTSGASGLHVFAPLGARYTYEQSRQFALIICTIVNKRLPAITSLERVPERRRRKVYLDFLQNIRGKSMAAVYSLRPYDGAPVSTPLGWEEVRAGLSPRMFTMRNIPGRLERYGDLFKPVLGEGIDMKACLDRLKGLL
jgi:bifunctional non-homologous end joining protein LigD